MAIRHVARYAIVGLAALLVSCGAAQEPTAGSGAATTSTAPIAATSMDPGMMQGTATVGMDHGMMQETATAGMDHGGMMGTSDAPYDAQFIDSMIVHHEGAIAMARQTLDETERNELKTLSQTIITAQEAEVKQLQDWRKEWYPDLAPTAGMGMDMGDMQLSEDTSKSFDQRFIDAMIAHHQGAVAMARDALQKAERQEIKTLAENIITAQEAEITQLQQ